MQFGLTETIAWSLIFDWKYRFFAHFGFKSNNNNYNSSKNNNNYNNNGNNNQYNNFTIITNSNYKNYNFTLFFS